MPDAVIDTNVVLRHLLHDDPGLSQAATALLLRIEAGEVNGRLGAIAIAEAVWVLGGRIYSFRAEEIRDALVDVLRMPNLVVLERERLIKALDLFAAFKLDFADAYHAALALEQGGSVYSFDRDFDRIPGVTRVEPPASRG